MIRVHWFSGTIVLDWIDNVSHSATTWLHQSTHAHACTHAHRQKYIHHIIILNTMTGKPGVFLSFLLVISFQFMMSDVHNYKVDMAGTHTHLLVGVE